MRSNLVKIAKYFSIGLALFLLLAVAGCEPRDNGKLPRPLNQTERQFRAQRRQQQFFTWTRDELLTNYEKWGVKNPAWDEQARNLFNTFAELHSGGSSASDLRTACESAVRAGCTDPLVRYFYLREVLAPADGSTNSIPSQFNEVYAQIAGRSYSDLRKFYAALRASQQLGRIKPISQTASDARLQEAGGFLKNFLDEGTVPGEEVYLAASDFFDTVNHRMKISHDVWDEMDPHLKKHYGKTVEYHLLRGEEYIHFAWKGRGGGFADKVTRAGWKQFAERLKIAHYELLAAYKLDPYDGRVPTQMIEVCVGRQLPREQMEIWFKRAMIADPNNIAAVRAKVRYLGPNWYGSPEEMIEFGRECVRNPAWGPSIPLELVQIHSDISSSEKDWRSYYRRPEVYQDIRDAYVEYLRRNPEETWERQNWLRYAYLAGDTADMREQYTLLRQNVDPNAYYSPEFYQEVKSFLEKLGPAEVVSPVKK